MWLEIGFGGGEHLAAQAEAHPGIGFIGCEPFIDGVARLLGRIAGRDLGNVRILSDDAWPLIEALEGDSIGRVFVLFPDPWPKRRHHKRRLLSDPMLDELARVLKPGADLRLATDHAEYCRWALARILRHPSFEWLARRAGDWRLRPRDWPPTRYEEKARAQGRPCIYLSFRRAGGGALPGAPAGAAGRRENA